MSQVTIVQCTICNPLAGDSPVRYPVNMTSAELVGLIQHILVSHTPFLARVEEG